MDVSPKPSKHDSPTPTTVPGTTATALTTKLFNKLSSAASAGDAAKMQALLAPLDPRKAPQQAGKNLGGSSTPKQPGTTYKALPRGEDGKPTEWIEGAKPCPCGVGGGKST